jgi:hypothetical protein
LELILQKVILDLLHPLGNADITHVVVLKARLMYSWRRHWDEFKYETKLFPTNVIIYRAGEKKEMLVEKENTILMKYIATVTKGASKGIAFWLDTKPGARFVDSRYENVPAGTVVNNPGSNLDF